MYGPDFFDSDILSEEDKFKQVALISHEIGHHWIGNLVTLKWWNDLWINEAGFTKRFLRFFVSTSHIELDQYPKVIVVKSVKGLNGIFCLS